MTKRPNSDALLCSLDRGVHQVLQSNNVVIYANSSSFRGFNCGHTVATNLYYVQQTTVKSCGHCTNSCGSGCMYSLVSTPIHPPIVLLCLSDRSEGTWGIPHIPLSTWQKASNQAGTQGRWLRNGSIHSL